MSDEIRGRVRRRLEAHNTATLATTGPAGPWAATVFYASDARLRLYFVSDPRTRHGRDLDGHPEAAAAINADCPDWTDILGLQLTGSTTTCTGRDREQALDLYLAKFPAVRALIEQPGSADAAVIAERLAAATLYCLTPRWIRLIDNGRGFGFKEELRLD